MLRRERTTSRELVRSIVDKGTGGKKQQFADDDSEEEIGPTIDVGLSYVDAVALFKKELENDRKMVCAMHMATSPCYPFQK